MIKPSDYSGMFEELFGTRDFEIVIKRKKRPPADGTTAVTVGVGITTDAGIGITTDGLVDIITG